MDVFAAYSVAILPSHHVVIQAYVGQEPAVRWAQRHSAGKFCHGDGRNLTWLPEADGGFEAEIAAGELVESA